MRISSGHEPQIWGLFWSPHSWAEWLSTGHWISLGFCPRPSILSGFPCFSITCRPTGVRQAWTPDMIPLLCHLEQITPFPSLSLCFCKMGVMIPPSKRALGLWHEAVPTMGLLDAQWLSITWTTRAGRKSDQNSKTGSSFRKPGWQERGLMARHPLRQGIPKSSPLLYRPLHHWNWDEISSPPSFIFIFSYLLNRERRIFLSESSVCDFCAPSGLWNPVLLRRERSFQAVSRGKMTRL